MKQNYIYIPSAAVSEFKCKVPLKNTRQLFLVNGMVQGSTSPFRMSLRDGEMMKEMLQIISVRNSDHIGELSFAQSYTFGRGSSAKILQCSHTLTTDSFLTKERVDIEVGEDAVIEFIVMQNEHNKAEHDTCYDINIARGGVLKMTFLSLHGGVITNTMNVNLLGEHAECELSGLYLTDSKQLMQSTISMNHLVPECNSSQLFKGILDDDGVTRFNGKITVAQGAQKTQAYQANHNLLISDSAKAYTQPQLEIYADDVKCSHGATIGRLNEMELFYMRTRGITEKEARLLQQMAFAYEVLQKVSNEELRERLQSMVEKRLKGEFSHCKNCSRNCC